ncbi:MAG TPA: DeoR/GlpR family DNA-binding transcription regulator [Candidatus Sulfotelmatobacter sp.]|nr:DeoR/GlpR family DNA-binding transcription regulator [Candidatus Sulfotelmatobacter sp.]
MAKRKQARHHQIIAELAANPVVRISSLATQLGVSAETVRRDIDELTRRGVVERTYGGAAVRPVAVQPAVLDRDRLSVAERARIGRHAAGLVRAGDVVMIDSGSTTTQLARALGARPIALTVLTNNIDIAAACAHNPDCRVILAPGDFDARERGLYGAETTGFLRRFHADLAFIGASGLTVDGPTEVETRAVWVKREMLERAAMTRLLVDSTKFGGRHLEIVCPLERLGGIVTDRAPEGALGAAVRRARIDLEVASDETNLIDLPQ